VLTLSEVETINDSGIQSLSGFAYQIRVFIYYMAQMENGASIEFETMYRNYRSYKVWRYLNAGFKYHADKCDNWNCSF